MRRTKLLGGLTGISPAHARSPKGRPSSLSDLQLHDRRDQLVQIFESRWGGIGWELQRCKQPDDLIRVFESIATAESWLRDELIIFSRPSCESVSSATLRKLRGELDALGERIRAAEDWSRRSEELLLQINELITKAAGRSPELRQVQQRRSEEFEKAAQDYRMLLTHLRDLEARVRALESSFARLELFRFLSTKRYALQPVNLANAAAGLPNMGWRQSMRRCIKISCQIANGLAFQIFEAIRYLTRSAMNETQDALVTTFQVGIPSLPNRYKLPKAELAEKWFYLEFAIRQAHQTKLHPQALPFEITKLYFSRIQFPPEFHLILAEQAKLNVSS